MAEGCRLWVTRTRLPAPQHRGFGALLRSSAVGGAVSQRLEIYGDYVCPYCYLMQDTLARLAEDGVLLQHRAAELYPSPWPLGEWPYPETEWEAVVAPLAAELGVAVQRPRLPTRTRKAHEAAAFARERGRFRELHETIFRAYFQEGRDIGRIDVLVELGAVVGLERMELKVALDVDMHAARIARETEAGWREGIQAVPAYVRRPAESGVASRRAAAEVRYGVRSYESMRAWLASGASRDEEIGGGS